SSNDGRVLIWDSSSGTPHRTLTGGVNALSFSPDGHSLATGGWDGVVRVWNVESGSVVCEFKGHRAEVLSVCFSPDGSAVASAGADRAVRLMDVAAGTQRCWMQGHSGKDACVCQRYGPASPDCPVEGHRGVVSCVGFSPDGATLASGGDDNTVKIWDAATGA
ncbi:WD40-repeat-containing domain protein, partial [Baffinella frigidus]